MKLNKFGSSIPYCLDPNVPLRKQWEMALKDPAYLLAWAIAISAFGVILFFIW